LESNRLSFDRFVSEGTRLLQGGEQTVPDRANTARPRNAFEVVTVASARARQLLEGCVPKIDGSPKPARRALQEVIGGVVSRETETAPPDAAR
jgi:DNA-directed RNA polymerase subunit K/omega